MQLVAGLQVGSSSVTGWVADVEGRVQARIARPLPVLRPAADRLELDPAAWDAACRDALSAAVAAAPPGDWLGVTVSTPGESFVLLDRTGKPLGNGILRGDRRGAAFADVMQGQHALTGRRPAQELTLQKLLAVRAEEPERWGRVTRILFLHDWLVARMTGVHATEVSHACSGGMADVAHRTWAADLLLGSGIRRSQLAPVVGAGAIVGELLRGWGAPPTLPVVAGCVDDQLSAMGAGGLRDGVITVIADGVPRVQLATAKPSAALQSAGTVSTHAAAGLWAVEPSLPGSAVDPLVIPAQIAELEHVLGRKATGVVVCGEAAADERLAAQLAAVLGRDVHRADRPVATVAAAVLVARAVGVHAHVPRLPPYVTAPGGAA